MNITGKWFGRDCFEFDFEGRRAMLVYPEKADEKKNWSLKTEYRDAFPETELALLDLGFHVAHLENVSRFATPEDCDAKARFVKYLHEEMGLRDKCVPVGMSCGGAHAINFAGYHPECVQCMFIDAPVLNFCDFPGRIGAKFASVWDNEFIKAYPGMTRAKLFNFEYHPINRVPVIKERKIPILMVYGTEDETVCYDMNGRLMELEYEDFPELLTVMAREGQGHHPHGFPDNPKIITDFIVKHCD